MYLTNQAEVSLLHFKSICETIACNNNNHDGFLNKELSTFIYF